MNSFSSRPVSSSGIGSEVELSVSCTNLRDRDYVSKSDPSCVLFVKQSGQWVEHGRTEQIKDNLNPSWTTKFLIKYTFEERQLIRFSIYDIDSKRTDLRNHDPLGELECSLGEIMANQSKGFKRPLSRGQGEIKIHAEEITNNNSLLTFKLIAENLDKKDMFGKSDPYYEIKRINESNDYSVVYRSEVIENNLNPNWKEVRIESRTLCNGDLDRALKIEVFDKDSNSSDLIGACKTNLRKLLNGPGQDNIYDCVNEKKKIKKGSKYKNSGLIKLTSIRQESIPSFLDFIHGGLQLNFTVAVDFTASNGPPQDPRSLHYQDPLGAPNSYMSAIHAVGDIIQDYDYDKMFPCLGFGARVPPHMDVSHEFYLNLDPSNPFCAGIGGIMTAYQTSLAHVQLHGPTNFSPVIRHVSRFGQAHVADQRNYSVLLIITDGVITDYEETKAAIAQASQLPMSIIIVGVGNDDFEAMENLDGDQKQIGSRDIVQFVRMNRFQTPAGVNREMLARAVLAEIPQQVCSWMKINGFQPQNRV